MMFSDRFVRCVDCKTILTSKMKVKYHTKWGHLLEIVKINFYLCPFCMKDIIIPPGYTKDMIFCPYCKQSIILGEKDLKEMIIGTIGGKK